MLTILHLKSNCSQKGQGKKKIAQQCLFFVLTLIKAEHNMVNSISISLGSKCLSPRVLYGLYVYVYIHPYSIIKIIWQINQKLMSLGLWMRISIFQA